MFKGFSKLLICGGQAWVKTCEVIDLESSATTCKNLPNFPITSFHKGIGGLGFNENPTICGGWQNGAYSKMCYSLKNNEWGSFLTMNSVREYGAAAQLKDGKLVVTGSTGRMAEILTDKGWEINIPSFPVSIRGHCMVTVTSTTVMAIGGEQNGQNSGKTFFFTFGEESWTEGPELKHNRFGHSCGKIRKDKDTQEISIIVAGAFVYPSLLSSVEILNAGSNEWQAGPELPFGIKMSQMADDQNGGVVLIGGYSVSNYYLDTLYRLPHGGQDATWTRMEQKLKTGRNLHTAFLVPDNIVDCS